MRFQVKTMRWLVAGVLLSTFTPVFAGILGNLPGQADLPALTQDTIEVDGRYEFVNTTVTDPGVSSLNLNDIQGDILVGMKKLKQHFVFFEIKKGKRFLDKLKGKKLSNMITTTAQLLDPKFEPRSLVNIAFSHSGLVKLGVDVGSAEISEPLFKAGQFSQAGELGDAAGQPDWVGAFKGTNVHGVFLIASDDWEMIALRKIELEMILGDDWDILHTLRGAVRPDEHAGKEHFGYMDGISQPGIQQFTTTPMPGQSMIPAGTILVGEEGDESVDSRPAWARGGSFLAFRQLQQFVPEFKQYLDKNALRGHGMSRKQGAELLGARMVGRWPSGAPVDLAPLHDDPELGADPLRNNAFTYSHPGEDLKSDQSRCPFSAHIRKTHPRDDLVNTRHQLIRAGIPYGPEVSLIESALKRTVLERGLAFVSYQSSLGNGFQFMQQAWANTPTFTFGKNDTTPGFDPIVGQNKGGSRFASGLDPNDPDRDYHFPIQHVISRGGEYFFSPSISAIKSGFQ